MGHQKNIFLNWEIINALLFLCLVFRSLSGLIHKYISDIDLLASSLDISTIIQKTLNMHV